MKSNAKSFLTGLAVMLACAICFAAVSSRHTQYFDVKIIDNPQTAAVTEGTLIVGDGTPDVTLDGEDAYIEGTLEVDGVLYADGGTSTSGNAVFSDWTMENGEVIDNAVDAAVQVTFNDDAVELGDLQITSSNTSTSDNDYLRQSWYMEDDGSVKTEAARLDVTATDVTSNTFDSSIEFAVVTNDTLTSELSLTGAALTPGANQGLDLGSSALKFNDLYLGGDAAITGNTSLTGNLSTTGTTTFNGGIVYGVQTSVSLTSPNVTISAESGGSPVSLIVLTSDANQTGAVLTGGTLNQRVLIVSGPGSNTVRFDDSGTTMALGANFTVTEGEGDTLELLCTNAAGDNWSRVGGNDN